MISLFHETGCAIFVNPHLISTLVFFIFHFYLFSVFVHELGVNLLSQLCSYFMHVTKLCRSPFVGDEERIAPSDAVDILCHPEWQVDECHDVQNSQRG